MHAVYGPRALLELTFILNNDSAHTYCTWAHKTLSGATVRRRRRSANLPVGVVSLRNLSDSEQVSVLMVELAAAYLAADAAMAPAPPGPGAMGAEQLTLWTDETPS